MAYLANDGILKISFEDSLEFQDEKPGRIYPFASSNIFNSNVACAVKLTHGENVKAVYDIGIDLQGIEYDFLPGDAIGVLPCNDEVEIKGIFDFLSCSELLDKECLIIINNEKKKKAYAHLPARATLRSIFIHNVDIRTPPKKVFLKGLAKYCSNDEDIRFIETICHVSNSVDYIEFISTTGRSLLQILKKIPSCKPPLDFLLENLSPLQPRPYSISSSPLIKSRLHITFSVVQVAADLKGVCTSYLEDSVNKFLLNTSEDVKLRFYFRKPNLFRFPTDLSRQSIIMIGPGTGVAPFRGFLEHLSLLSRKIDTWLFFGCRYKERDFLYKSEFEQYLEDDYLQKLTVAFSREQAHKVYVTHLMRSESKLLFDKLKSSNSIIYVCGDGRYMMQDVKDAVLWCLEDNGNTKEDAQELLKDLIKENRYIEDKWI